MTAHATWAAALDRLEHDLREAEGLLDSPATRPTDGPADSTADRPTDSTAEAWTAPAVEGPIPAELRDRARALAGRQQEVLRAITRAHGATTRQHRLADRLSAVTAASPHPVYVDARA